MTGLHKAHFKTLTDIQRKAIPSALKGRDVLGAAKTGSGKTLAFLVPVRKAPILYAIRPLIKKQVLEILYRKKWTTMDGLGALIISPTRELATQIFDVLRKIGREHTFSAGLVIGGKKLKDEQEALHRMNIVVCTPGRMLQHMDQTVGLTLDNVQMLVLDEADRILDMGFRKTLDAIIENLPKERQTLLFSATQTKSVSELARLGLKDPEYIAVHEAAASATPTGLDQFYMITPLPEKLNTLFAFLRNHLQLKIVVFMSSCKQVRFVYETFRQLHIGIPLLHLHGKQKQSARIDITAKFSAAKQSCLFSTDVIARGLDFPAVDWVIQLDAPEDADTYIHRVGRTARFEKTGKALLFLCPSEEKFTDRLTGKKVPINKVGQKNSKKQSIQNQLQGLLFKDPELKYLGQKAFVSYCRSISIQKDGEVFKLVDLPLDEYAASIGLLGAPRIKGLKNVDAAKIKEIKNAPRGLKALEDASNDEGEGEAKNTKEARTKYDRMVERSNYSSPFCASSALTSLENINVLTDHYANLVQDDGAEPDDEGDFLTVKRSGYDSDIPGPAETPSRTLKVPGKEIIIDSKRKEKMLKSKKELVKHKPKGTKLIFDDEGEAHQIYELQDEDKFREAGPAETQRRKFLDEEGRRVKEADIGDRKLAKEKRKEKRRIQKLRAAEEKAGMEGSDEDEFQVELVPYGDAACDQLEQDGDVEEESQPKRQRKWFEDDEGMEKAKRKAGKARGRVIEAAEAPEDLAGLEMLASGLIG